jgi:hypothetical protein
MTHPFGGSGRTLARSRGSWKRLRSIRMRGNCPLEIWGLLVLALLMLFVGLPWAIRHRPSHGHHHVFGETERPHK